MLRQVTQSPPITRSKPRRGRNTASAANDRQGLAGPRPMPWRAGERGDLCGAGWGRLGSRSRASRSSDGTFRGKSHECPRSVPARRQGGAGDRGCAGLGPGDRRGAGLGRGVGGRSRLASRAGQTAAEAVAGSTGGEDPRASRPTSPARPTSTRWSRRPSTPSAGSTSWSTTPGINIRGPIEQLSEADWDQVLDTNLKGPGSAAGRSAEPMKRQKWGRVINVSSMLGEISLPGRTPYASSKGGLTLLTKTLALEWAARRDQRQRPLPRPVRHRDQHAAAERPGGPRRDAGEDPARAAGATRPSSGRPPSSSPPRRRAS